MPRAQRQVDLVFEERQEGQYDRSQVRQGRVQGGKLGDHIDTMVRSESFDLKQEEKLV